MINSVAQFCNFSAPEYFVGAKEYRGTRILYYVHVTDSLVFHARRINLFLMFPLLSFSFYLWYPFCSLQDPQNPSSPLPSKLFKLHQLHSSRSLQTNETLLSSKLPQLFPCTALLAPTTLYFELYFLTCICLNSYSRLLVM